jgi:hypothetical protein
MQEMPDPHMQFKGVELLLPLEACMLDAPSNELLLEDIVVHNDVLPL